MTTNPTIINGAWSLGWTLDQHTKSSIFLGYDELGHARYETIRTDLGELLYELKYHGKRTASEIGAVMARFLKEKPNALARIDLVVPVPPSVPRANQPVVDVAAEIARILGKNVAIGAVRKVRDTPGLKNIVDPEERRELLDGAFAVDGERVRGKGVLLIDDLYRSGATANAVTVALIRSGAARVYFLAATRTRSNT